MHKIILCWPVQIRYNCCDRLPQTMKLRNVFGSCFQGMITWPCWCGKKHIVVRNITWNKMIILLLQKFLLPVVCERSAPSWWSCVWAESKHWLSWVLVRELRSGSRIAGSCASVTEDLCGLHCVSGPQTNIWYSFIRAFMNSFALPWIWEEERDSETETDKERQRAHDLIAFYYPHWGPQEAPSSGLISSPQFKEKHISCQIALNQNSEYLLDGEICVQTADCITSISTAKRTVSCSSLCKALLLFENP